MSIPSMDQIRGTFNAIYQGIAFATEFIPPLYNSISGYFHMKKIYEDPDMDTVKKTASLLLTAVNVHAESSVLAHKINGFPKEELQKMAKIANIARTGIDIFNLHALENPRAWDVCAAGIRSQIKMEQIAYDRKDLNILINVMETAEICYKNRAMFSSALKTLYKKPLQVSQTVRTSLQIQSTTNNQQTNIQTAPVQIDAQEATSIQQTNIQIFYQNLLSKLRETFQGSYNELELLDLLNQEIHAELKIIQSKLKECEAIINGEDITHFDAIPFLLQGEVIFQKRMCRISGKPIRKVVTVRESDNSKPIYYEWKNLQQALEKDTRPFKWPASLAFDPKFSVINMEETKEVINELKKASLNPEFKKKAQDTYAFYETKKEEFEEVCKLIKTNLKTS